MGIGNWFPRVAIAVPKTEHVQVTKMYCIIVQKSRCQQDRLLPKSIGKNPFLILPSIQWCLSVYVSLGRGSIIPISVSTFTWLCLCVSTTVFLLCISVYVCV